MFAGLALGLGTAGCSRAPETVQLAGSTMGTTWHVTLPEVPEDLTPADVQQGIESRLEDINDSMSTYRPDSEISRFNRVEPGVPVTTSRPFREVLATALDIGDRTRGAYDITVGPLVDLWGFGPQEQAPAVPAADAIDAARARVGQDKLRLLAEDMQVVKEAPIGVDFSSLAKGFAVDVLARWLEGRGISRYLVEVGGEMRVAGMSPRGEPWRIAIERPDSAGRGVARAILVSDGSVATSGDYRNYFEVDGRRYSHSIDPRTGYPVTHDLVSVTVVHDSAMAADAWATALAVLGASEATQVATAEGLAVYFIQRVGEDFTHSYTPAFEAYLESSADDG